MGCLFTHLFTHHSLQCSVPILFVYTGWHWVRSTGITRIRRLCGLPPWNNTCRRGGRRPLSPRARGSTTTTRHKTSFSGTARRQPRQTTSRLHVAISRHSTTRYLMSLSGTRPRHRRQSLRRRRWSRGWWCLTLTRTHRSQPTATLWCPSPTIRRCLRQLEHSLRAVGPRLRGQMESVVPTLCI